MIKELREEIKFVKENPVAILLLLTVTGILPAIFCGILFKIFGIQKGVIYMKEKSISSKGQEKISMLDYILLENCTNEGQRKQMLKIIK